MCEAAANFFITQVKSVGVINVAKTSWINGSIWKVRQEMIEWNAAQKKYSGI